MADPSIPATVQRLWTVPEANARIEDLKELLPQMGGWVHRLRAIHDELQRMSAFWGKESGAHDQPDRPVTDRLDGEFKQLTKRIEEEVGRLHAEGIEVKDLDAGLVDFLARIDGDLVFLCWKHGEESVQYFHPLTGGFSGRRPLPGTRPATTARSRAGGR
ncbi:MAG TPA: DUF2203 domain-containing protein [Thermoplasmata archaeon]|nr:DUF2203 domain-containing protein [Thermoplasmata archaeon]